MRVAVCDTARPKPDPPGPKQRVLPKSASKVVGTTSARPFDGVIQESRYDDSRRLKCIYSYKGTAPTGTDDEGCPSASTSLVTFFSYDYTDTVGGVQSDTNRREKLTERDASTTSYDYDAIGRLTAATTAKSGSTTRKHAYTYDALGNPTKEVVSGSTVTNSTRTQAYDDSGESTSGRGRAEWHHWMVERRDLGVSEQTMDFRGFRLWYRSVGRQESGLPLLCLHGGPGIPHDYLEPLEGLASTGRCVVFYDQLGCGNSDRPSDPSFWTVSSPTGRSSIRSRRRQHLQGTRDRPILFQCGMRLQGVTYAEPVGQLGQRRANVQKATPSDLYKQHAPWALRLAYLLTGNEEAAQDLMHDAFVKVFGRPRGPGDIPLHAFSERRSSTCHAVD